MGWRLSPFRQRDAVATSKRDAKMTVRVRRREDTAEGCRSLSTDDRARAVEMANPQMRASLERSANAWSTRAQLLEHVEASSNARVEAHFQSLADPE
jgi:hypothetical protein